MTREIQVQLLYNHVYDVQLHVHVIVIIYLIR